MLVSARPPGARAPPAERLPLLTTREPSASELPTEANAPRRERTRPFAEENLLEPSGTFSLTYGGGASHSERGRCNEEEQQANTSSCIATEKSFYFPAQVPKDFSEYFETITISRK